MAAHARELAQETDRVDLLPGGRVEVDLGKGNSSGREGVLGLCTAAPG